ncbi:MAG: effector-associated domain EAD1-containing protein [Capsulimonas sp.]|uniref:effector-associated domain EAD1-containing protein n=1 Tax=Capsulimonas sp. TaxID=2494211 RepID=UPI003264A7C3
MRLQVSKDVIVNFLAENYPTHQSARGLWERAGGSRGDVPMAETPREMWYELWRKSSIGAIVSPSQLLAVALDDTPKSSVLIEAITELATLTDLEIGRSIVHYLETSNSMSEFEELTARNLIVDTVSVQRIYTILIPVVGSKSKIERESLQLKAKAFLSSVGQVAKGVYSETIAAITEGTVRALNQT